MELTLKQKAAYGIGAVGKDMVYALSASYAMYFYQDVLGLGATFVGLILMIARIFDAVNDPFMGVVVAENPQPLGTVPPVAVFGNYPQCSGAVCPICRPRPERGRTYGVLYHSIYSLGRNLYHDGHSLLVDDSCRYKNLRGARKPVRSRTYLRRSGQRTYCHVHHAAGRRFRRRRRANGIPLGSSYCCGNLCRFRGTVLYFL